MEVSSTPYPAFDESLLILSDVHLGNDLNDLDPDGIRRSEKVDTDLASLLAHYRRTPPAGKRWRLVIAGDFIDFIGMTILPRDRALDTEPSEEEREHGLGNAADHARVKLRAVAARHRIVFDALADFVAEGHALTIVHGNHDVEFHWDGVKEEMLALLLETAVSRGVMTTGGVLGEGPQNNNGADAYLGRIEFAPWFYYVGGVAYIEHGHQYDTLCSTENGLAPLSPLDPRRIARTFSDVFLRWVVRPTRGVPEYGHEKMGLVDYVLLGARMGFGGLLRLFVRYLSAVVELFRLRRAHLSEATRALRQEHERRMGLLAEKTRLGIEKLRALAALQVPPVTRSAEKILASVLLDRLAVALLATAAIAAIVLFAPYHSWMTWASLGVVAGAWVLAHLHFSSRRRAWFGEKLDNDETLAERAGHLARLFPAAFVVMGHTHSPAMLPVAEGAATYVNVGSWHEAEPPADPEQAAHVFRAARTHLVIHPAPSGPVAQFLAWDGSGPRSFPQRDS
jgi:UDP-2,3-diacylglucosamine pyrophosphatase LpxH